jgi:16S rRNA (cytidine1402-2'-O)-methyltransferase
MNGLLSLVSTPIGNLQDTTLRAIKTFSQADLIACEDTRVTGVLLKAHGISSKHFLSIHHHTPDHALSELIEKIHNGLRVAYASDAGTPGVNDPGGRLVELAYEAGIHIEVIPGPSALTAAISACGFPMEHFSYIGFIPQKNHRRATFVSIAERKEPTIFFESTHRILKTLNELSASLQGERLIYVGRELTKKFETHLRAPITDVIAHLEKSSIKGEFTVIVGPVRLK